MLFPPALRDSMRYIHDPGARRIVDLHSVCVPCLGEVFGIRAISGLLRQCIYLFIAQSLMVACSSPALIVRLYLLQRRRPRVSLPLVQKKSHFHSLHTRQGLGSRSLIP